MTSFDCRLKAIKACSACGNLHTSAFCCSKEKLKNKILVPMPESSQQHIKIERICFDCGNLLHGLNCLECDLTRKILEKAFQKFQNTSKSSNDNSNVVNAPREPFVVKQDPSINSSQKSPLIDQKCCCKCGDSLDGIFCQRCTSGYQQKDRKPSQNDKTEHGMEKTVQNQGQRMQLRLSCLTSRSIISTGSSTTLSLSSSQISFIGMMRDLSHKHDKLQTLIVGCFPWLVLCFCSSWLDDPPCCKSDTCQCKLLCDVGCILYTNEDFHDVDVLLGGITAGYNGNFLEFKTSRDRYRDNGMSDPIGGLVYKGLRKSDGKRKDMSYHTTGYRIDNLDIYNWYYEV
ncbi:hypothetical protein Tco_1152818 [Tanacetum coccineum]